MKPVIVESPVNGSICVMPNDKSLGRCLIETGEFAPGPVAMIRQMLKPGCVAIDVGANFGSLAVPMAKAVGPDGVVFAIEPQRLVYHCLVTSATMSEAWSMRCIHAVAGRERGVMRVGVPDPDRSDAYGSYPITDLAEGAVDLVPVMRIDDLELAVCHLIKIDVEGAEMDVLEGARETIARCEPMMIVEADRPDQAEAIRDWLVAAGCAVFWFITALSSKPHPAFDGLASLDFVAVPKQFADRIGLPSADDLDWKRATEAFFAKAAA